MQLSYVLARALRHNHHAIKKPPRAGCVGSCRPIRREAQRTRPTRRERLNRLVFITIRSPDFSVAQGTRATRMPLSKTVVCFIDRKFAWNFSTQGQLQKVNQTIE